MPPPSEQPPAEPPPREEEEPGGPDPANPDLATGYGQMLSMVHGGELGDDPPPFPMPYGEDETGNEDFAVSETNLIVIGEGDSPAEERRKEAIAWAKVDIGEYVRAGGRAKDALAEIYAYRKECARMLIEASDDFRAWLTERPDQEEEVLAALAEFNERLRAEGIRELSVDEIVPFEDGGEDGGPPDGAVE